MDHRLNPGVHLAVLHSDLIVLDLDRDAYLYLLDVERGDEDHVMSAALTSAQLSLLEQAELVTPAAAALPLLVETGTRCWQDLITVPGPITARDVQRFVLCLVWTLWMVNRLSLAELGRLPVPAGSRNAAALARQVTIFDRLVPWLPFRGECLFRAVFLRRFLSAAGLSADWVFGVHLFPFRAHCWLACGTLVVGDAVHRVQAYEPIMTIAAAT